ncbi:class I SAM-dependent methyltransferase [Levilactobacillus hammesii]|uniref:SAM-dependent methyltransferase n=1 Tax=Levilactobacillus hammesii DSM 16381 TaxID=1423753 RepID=A0A0R1UQK8_9LACO|nr:class I SAM-dependent methyltransferase [Levilactobacillus hammesii]KRL95489.1 SAM-dependent methyltransferase [Levilactobacillus hammesii DSM 16381]
MKRVQITGKSVRKFEDGYPIVSLTDLENAQDFDNGAWVQLENHGHFVATAYFAKQHRGIGFVMSLRENEGIDERFFTSKFRAAVAKRAAFADSPAYRLFNGTGDGLGGLIVDVFNGQYVFRWQNSAIKQQAKLIYAGFERILGKGQTILAETPGQEHLQLISGQLEDQPTTIQEDGITYPIDLTLSRQQLALEFRDIRAWAKATSQQRRILNLFSAETGLVTAAMLGGATEAVTVDPTNRATTTVQAQLAANNFDQAAVEMRTMDVANYLDYAVKHDLTFDTIFINPPAFIRGKKRTFTLEQDLQGMVEQALQLAKSGTQLVITTTTPTYGMKRLRETINDAVQNYTGHVTVSNTYLSPNDFLTNRADRHSESLKGVQLTVD